MSRKEFSFLLKQYLAGNCTPEEKKFVEHWFGVLRNEGDEKADFGDLEELEPLMWEKIKSKAGVVQNERPLSSHRTIRWRWLSGVAAAVALVLVATWLLIPESLQPVVSHPDVPVMTADWVSERNESKAPVQFALPDGSVATLQPGAQLQYPVVFSDSERQVILKGEAFFEVSKMPQRPFFVYTGNLITKVLGTSFHIRSTARNGVSVEVVTGRVAVFERKSARSQKKDVPIEEIILLPNQKVVYFEDRHELVTGIVDMPQLVPQKETASVTEPLVFEEAALQTVLTKLEKAYGLSIQLENELQQNCPLTADLSDLSLYEQLDMICAATNSKYLLAGTSIIISGEGCANLP